MARPPQTVTSRAAPPENPAFPRGLPDGSGNALSGWAIFFDIDGTLLDIAETPDAVRVPESLIHDLVRLSRKLDGALALVTGRSIPFVDEIFRGVRFPVAGLHGAECRDAAGRTSRIELTPDFMRAKDMLKQQARRWPDILVEDKHAAIAVHYRQAPQYQGDMQVLMREIADMAGPQWTLQEGKMVTELRPAAHDKGYALKAFMADPPFSARRPLVFGDDVTDEAMFKAANAANGLSVKIGAPSAETSDTAATIYMGSPAILRSWLSEIAQ
ncbi:trehalose-phosphatase [Phyllobacterium phragmitis]|uniref:Trehalose 6-phosphate phosphatase n=1 Tax=Phyllobacterium phragmitis TaxID=2670329 RepID=A0A2S9IUL7_9HYPH|nr:trehalose-phosphatase [Phyllobacterium phragmitis]PRD44233.1 trehalose-phosphatase [Phyllobacterium phragmitis]